MRRELVVALAIGLTASCAKSPPSVSLLPSPAVIQARLDEADVLAGRGCYLCLKEAAEAYSKLLQMSDTPVVVKKALENDLMLAIREVELRLPDSGARQRAVVLQQRVPDSYAVYLTVLDALVNPLISGGITRQEVDRQRAERMELVTQLEREWPASAMKAYFYLAMALSVAQVDKLKGQIYSILDTHSHDGSLTYRLQAFPPTFSGATSKDLLASEPRFGEVHFVLGQRALFGAQLVTAHRELTRAHELLPQSAAIALVFGNLELLFSRYQESLHLFDRVLAAGPDEGAALGRAKALSYLKRFEEAIAALDELLKDLRSNPGEKYYWRAWNWLQLGDAQRAYDDATTALKVMANSTVYALTGMATFSIDRLAEARKYFDASLEMNATNCDSLRYLGQIDSIEKNWSGAAGHFSRASTCYAQVIARLTVELTGKESDTSGLLVGHVASLRAGIKEAQVLQAASIHNATVAANNAAVR